MPQTGMGLPNPQDYGDLSKLKAGQLLDFIIQEHAAQKAGLHQDIRLGSPELGLYSWATRKGLPEPGKRHALFQQPLHSHEYGNFEGTLTGYGAGVVRKHRRGQVLITNAEPGKIEFTTACVDGETLLDTDRGVFPIREVVQERNQVRVRGVFQGRVDFFPVERFHHKIAERVWCEVKFDTAQGEQTLVCTAEHRVFVPGRGFCYATELREGANLLFQRAFESAVKNDVALIAGADYDARMIGQADTEGDDVVDVLQRATTATACFVSGVDDAANSSFVAARTFQWNAVPPSPMAWPGEISQRDAVSQQGCAYRGGRCCRPQLLPNFATAETVLQVELPQQCSVLQRGMLFVNTLIGLFTVQFKSILPNNVSQFWKVFFPERRDGSCADCHATSDFGKGSSLKNQPSQFLSVDDQIMCTSHELTIATRVVVVKSIRQWRERRELFDLTVRDAQCYFANGVLTHNSDRHPQRFALVKPQTFGDKDWLVVNTTPREQMPYQKVHYAVIPKEQVEQHLGNIQNGEAQAKIDGASSLIELMKDGVEITSYRTHKDTGMPIVHTERVFGGRPKMKIPPELVGSVLKGELYGQRQLPTDSGRYSRALRSRSDAGPAATPGRDHDLGDGSNVFGTSDVLPPQELGGLLNATVANSLQAQRAKGIHLKILLHNIQRFGKQDVSPGEVPYAKRKQLLQEIVKHLPADTFHVGEGAQGTEAAMALWNQIKSGRHPLSREGIVIHPEFGKPYKAKITDEHDVHITGFFPGTGKRQDTVGGFTYSLHPGGPTVGRVGTGFSGEALGQFGNSPESFIGRAARIRSQGQFLALHEDWTPPAAEEKAAFESDPCPHDLQHPDLCCAVCAAHLNPDGSCPRCHQKTAGCVQMVSITILRQHGIVKDAEELPYRDRVEMYGLNSAGKVLGGYYDNDKNHRRVRRRHRAR